MGLDELDQPRAIGQPDDGLDKLDRPTGLDKLDRPTGLDKLDRPTGLDKLDRRERRRSSARSA